MALVERRQFHHRRNQRQKNNESANPAKLHGTHSYHKCPERCYSSRPLASPWSIARQRAACHRFAVFVAIGKQVQVGGADERVDNEVHGWLSAELIPHQADGGDQRCEPRYTLILLNGGTSAIIPSPEARFVEYNLASD